MNLETFGIIHEASRSLLGRAPLKEAFEGLLAKGEMMTMFTLPNGKHIDEDMIEAAMEDSDLTHSYYLNTQTGEVAFFSEYDDVTDEREQQLEEIEMSNNYVPIERIPTHEAYQWMEDFVSSIVAPKDAQVAEKLSIALMGKGAFGRFKAVLHRVGEEWVQA